MRFQLRKGAKIIGSYFTVKAAMVDADGEWTVEEKGWELGPGKRVFNYDNFLGWHLVITMPREGLYKWFVKYIGGDFDLAYSDDNFASGQASTQQGAQSAAVLYIDRTNKEYDL